MKRIFGGVLAALALSVSAGAGAQADGDMWTFSVTNNTDAILTDMRLAASADSRGNSFLSRQLAPGQTGQARFRSEEERCEFVVLLTFSDGVTMQNTVDFCTIEGITAERDGMHAY